jgi:phage gpG-like protein
MGKKVALKNLGEEIERRISARIRKYEPNSPELKAAMLRIGFLLEAQAKINLRRQGIIDTGRLLNSIRSEFYIDRSKVGIRVGSFGVPYASLHEFGGTFTDRQRRAMFGALRDRGKLGPGKGIDKGVVQGGRFLSRPYLRPAIVSHKNRIIEIIRNLFK